MERCMRCRVSENEVRLFDAIYEGRMGVICERCSIIENVPIIKKPNSEQLKESEKTTRVYDRMRRLSGIVPAKKDETFFIEDRLNELESHPEMELPEQKKLNLINHFHWEIMKNRRRRGFSPKQLADAIGESEVSLQMIENGKIPENGDVVIKKLEQIFQVSLRKVTETERIFKKIQTEPVLLDSSGHELDFIPEQFEEDEIEVMESVELGDDEDMESFELLDEEKTDENEDYEDDEKYHEFDIKKADLTRIKIDDLKNINRKRVEMLKQEKIDEKEKIEEHQRLVEAKKEELRLLRKKESEDIDNLLSGSEILGDNGRQI